MIPELLTSMINDGLYHLEKYGSIVCISVIENSSTPKTRGLAVRECQMCVERVGLNAIGKKGIITVAKSFSDETLTENKTSFLDLIEVVILKMGDMKKFLTICGTSNLSNKARETIEKRMSRKSREPSTAPPHRQQSRSTISSRRSLAPAAPGNHNRVMSEDKSSAQQEKLRDSSHRKDEEDNEGPFKFTFNSSSSRRNSLESSGAMISTESTTIISEERVLRRDVNSGAAASLRERLKLIRDRHQTDQDNMNSSIPASSEPSVPLELTPTPPSPNTYLRSIMEDVDNLLAQTVPLGKNTDQSSMALVGLRKFHASLTNGAVDSTGTDPSILMQLKQEISSKTSFCVFKLSRYVKFSLIPFIYFLKFIL